MPVRSTTNRFSALLAAWLLAVMGLFAVPPVCTAPVGASTCQATAADPCGPDAACCGDRAGGTSPLCLSAAPFREAAIVAAPDPGDAPPLRVIPAPMPFYRAALLLHPPAPGPYKPPRDTVPRPHGSRAPPAVLL